MEETVEQLESRLKEARKQKFISEHPNHYYSEQFYSEGSIP